MADKALLASHKAKNVPLDGEKRCCLGDLKVYEGVLPKLACFDVSKGKIVMLFERDEALFMEDDGLVLKINEPSDVEEGHDDIGLRDKTVVVFLLLRVCLKTSLAPTGNRVCCKEV